MALAEISDATRADRPGAAFRHPPSRKERRDRHCRHPFCRSPPAWAMTDLIEIAETKGEAAFAGDLGPLVAEGSRHRRAAGPPLSERQPPHRQQSRRAGFAWQDLRLIVAQAETDPELAVEAGIRVDLPSELRRQLLSRATEAVRTELLSRAPPHLFEEIRNAIAATAASADREMSRVHDFTAATPLRCEARRKGRTQRGRRCPASPSRRRYEETVAALAELAQSTD